MGVIADHRLQILQAGGLGRVRLERRRCLVRILRGKHRRIEHGLRQRPRHLRFFAHQAAAQSDDAAGLVLVFAVEVRGHFLVGGVLQPEIRDRVRSQERLDFTLLDGELQQIAGIDTPVDVLDRIDALLGELDREEVLVRSAEIADPHDLALEVGELVEPRIRARQNAHAAAMGARRNLDVKSLLQRLQPAQRHAEARIRLAGRNRLQQLVGRTAVIDQLDIEIVLLENAVVDRNRQRRETDRAGVPGQFQLPWRAGKRRGVGSRLADRELREVDRRRRSTERKGLRAEYADWRRERRRGPGSQQGSAVQQRTVLYVSRHFSSPYRPAKRCRRRNMWLLRPGIVPH